MEVLPSQFLFIIKSNILSVWKIKSEKNMFPLKISCSRVALRVSQRGQQWVKMMPASSRQQGPSWAGSPEAISAFHPSRRGVETNMVRRPDRPYWPQAAYPGPWWSLGAKSHMGVTQTGPKCAFVPSPLSSAWLQLTKEWQSDWFVPYRCSTDSILSKHVCFLKIYVYHYFLFLIYVYYNGFIEI